MVQTFLSNPFVTRHVLLPSFNPVVSFPFNRGPYPSYDQGVSLDTAFDDSADARAMAKDLLVYIGAFVEEELDEWDVTFTEGAESGMTHIWAGKVSTDRSRICRLIR